LKFLRLSNPRLTLLGLALVVLIGLGFANYHVSLRALGSNAFLPRWEAARQWLRHGVDPYDPAVSLAAQEATYGRPAEPDYGEDLGQFLYPLYAMIFYAPFAFLPYAIARAIWLTLLEICVLAFAFVAVRLSGWRPKPWLMAVLILFLFGWYHGFHMVIQTDFAPIEGLLVAGGLLAIQRNNDRAAGILLALSTVNLQMSWLVLLFVLVWSLVKRRWQLIRWMAVSTLVLLGISLLLIPNWVVGWLRQIVTLAKTADVASPIVTIAGIAPTLTLILWRVLAIVLGLHLLLQWAVAISQGGRWFQWAAALTIAVGNLLMLRTTSSNYILMFPALCLVASTWTRRWGNRGDLAVAIACLISIVGLWVLYLATGSRTPESPLLFLPMPILTIVALWWTRSWITQRTDLTFESASSS
jgi:hypothetical protein